MEPHPEVPQEQGLQPPASGPGEPPSCIVKEESDSDQELGERHFCMLVCGVQSWGNGGWKDRLLSWGGGRPLEGWEAG